MLYQVLKRMILRGEVTGLRGKIDVFFAVNRVTQEEYTELCGMLTAQA